MYRKKGNMARSISKSLVTRTEKPYVVACVVNKVIQVDFFFKTYQKIFYQRY